MRFVAAVVGALIGVAAGYLLGVYGACWLWPESNLCGLVGVLVTGPLGLLAGGVIGWCVARPRVP